VNPVLEDMLRACILDHQGVLDQCLPLPEFSYNNSYQESIRMVPFEALYGCRCRSPLNWIKPGEKVIFGPDLITEAEETMWHIQANMKLAKLWQESYANKGRQPLEFEVGDHIYLFVSPMKGVKRFGAKGNLTPYYIEHFPILERSGPMDYKLDLPPSLAGVYDVFHVLQLKKCLKAPSNVVLSYVALLEQDLSYPEHPIKLLDQKYHAMR
jgi:hypothetical protein